MTARNQLYGELRYRQAPFYVTLEGLYARRSLSTTRTPSSPTPTRCSIWSAASSSREGWRMTELPESTT